MAKPLPLPVFDRRSGKLFQEWMDDSHPTYESNPTRSLTQWVRSQPLFDQLDAAYQHTRYSSRKIDPFIRKYHINMDEFERVSYRSYDDFFIRRFRRGVRAFPSNPSEMGAFAEARYFGWNKLETDQQFPIKGYSLNAERILGSAEWAAPFVGGPIILARLAPVDYHHAHYPDEGITLRDSRIGGRLWTVNWHALQNKPDILFKNERYISILETHNFGRLAFVEIGALTVGRIVQVHRVDAPFKRCDEKSFFHFGGSAIVVFGEARAWRPSDDLLKHTSEGVETFVRLGETIAVRA
jgi:phosphatidylserine decarboxylase